MDVNVTLSTGLLGAARAGRSVDFQLPQLVKGVVQLAVEVIKGLAAGIPVGYRAGLL